MASGWLALNSSALLLCALSCCFLLAMRMPQGIEEMPVMGGQVPAVMVCCNRALRPLPFPCSASPAGTQASIAAEVERLAGSAHLLQAACWELRGSRQLLQAHSLIALDTFGDVARAEDQCAALAQLASSVAAAHGYQAAEQLLAAADERFPQAQSRVLRAARLAIAHDRALHRRELHAAMDIATQMAALASPTDSTDITVRWVGSNWAGRQGSRQWPA